MLTSETKRHIDAARQVLVGVVPNPSSQIDQITNALIYKFMDDMDQSAIKAGGSPSFFIEDLEKYAWTRLMDSRLGNQERMNLYAEALQKFSEAKQLPELFRGIFKSAFLPYRSPEVLGLFLKEINYFDYSHPEDLGDGYEYLLSIMSSQGDAGQFRTPRHIIDFIVDAVNPSKDDKVLDPACGTGGFLVSSYKHILEQHDGKDETGRANKEKPLTPDDRKKLFQNFEGYDIDPGMVRIAQVNMYLHQFKNPKIFQYDTLGMDERWNDKFDVILANPPFMSPKGGVRPHSKFSVQSSRSEVLFVDYIMNHLKPKGRAGIIVPEGIIFQSGSAHKQLRKNLVNDGLCAVVSLPSGVFQPYSGVKTSILLFDNELAKQKLDILFVKVENDGFSLSAQRREIAGSNLPTALDILNKWRKGEKVESKLAVCVEKNKIAKSGDYNLSGDRYRVATDYTNAKWSMVKLGEIVVEMKDGGTPSRSKPEYFGGKINWAVVKDIRAEIYDTKEKLTEAGLQNSSAKLWPVDSVIISLGATIGNVGIAKVPVATKQGLSGIVVDKERILPKYLYYILVAQKEFIQSQATGASIKEVRPSKLQEVLTIPLPPLEIQEQIVTELDGYAGIIAGAKQIAQNWKPKIDIDPEWEKVRLGEVCEKITDGSHFSPETTTIGYPYITVRDLTDGVIDFEQCKFVNENDYESLVKNGCKPSQGDVLFSKDGTVGKVAKINFDKDFVVLSSLAIITPRIRKLDFQFLELVLLQESVLAQALEMKGGAAIKRIILKDIKQIEIPLPLLEIQKQIVEKIEAERALVESSKKLIDIYEQKTKDAIAKLWEE
ncbi:MAG: N-6 DNA methylase [Candidatus Paceibacterota bacterium]